MTRPTTRNGTKSQQFQRRIPADLSERLKGRRFTFRLPGGNLETGHVTVTAKAGTHIAFSLGTAERSLATLRHAAALSQVEALFKSEREGPQELSFKAIQALAGLAYNEVISANEENPGRAGDWRLYREFVAEAGEYLDPEGDGISSPAYDPKAAERALRAIFDVDGFLLAHGVSLTRPDRGRFVEAVALALRDASKTLEARASRDYSPDANAIKFPKWTKPSALAPSTAVQSFDELFSRWKAETEPSASTVSTWEGHVRKLTTFLGHDDPKRVTNADLTRWKDALVAEGRKQVNKSYLAAIKALYSYAVTNAATTGIASNPMEGVKALQKTNKAGQRRLPYENAEVEAILVAARSGATPALRWMPWLLAQTGARVGEVAQLWGSMVIEHNGIPCLNLTPAEDGGTLKNEGSERIVPLHPEIIAEGFLSFVKKRGDGPLFYGAHGNRKAARARGDGASRHPSKGAANRVAAWIRELGFKDPRKAPNHAFRHWLKTALMETGCPDRLADLIQGHAPKSEGDGYAHGRARAMLEALSKVQLIARASPAPKEAQ